MPDERPSSGDAQSDEMPTLSSLRGERRRVKPSKDNPFVPGMMLGKRYRIVSQLGQGGMGQVYRAEDLELGQTVALKFLPPRLAQDMEALDRLRSEVRVARQIAHPNVCRVYDIGECDGRYYLSMEYVDGEDLASVLRRLGRPSKEKSQEIARQLCAGLSAAHEAGILHRDLKPANVMIDGRGRVRITDFGLAGLVDQFRNGEAKGGTPAYMAPEQFRGDVSVRSDVYALGLVLYEVLTGRCAFKADTVAEIQELHETTTPSSPTSLIDHVDPTLERVVLRCLEKDPRERPGSVAAVAAALPGGDPLAAAIAAGETPSPEMVAAAGGRGGLRIGVGVALLIAALLGFATIAWLNSAAALYRLAPPQKPPVVLAQQASDLLSSLGLADHVADRAYGFRARMGYLEYLQTKGEMSAWEELGQGRPTAYEFWYRTSPMTLVPENPRGRVTWSDPPPLVPGMVTVLLDGVGFVERLEVIPPLKHSAAPAEVPPVDWTALLAATGLDVDQAQPVEPEWRPDVFADERRAWVAPYAGQPESRVRCEVAALYGRPVSLRIVAPFDTEWLPPGTEARATSEHILDSVGVLVLLGALLSAVWVARFNVRHGRGDRRGALHVGAFTFGLAMLSWGFGADHAPDPWTVFGMLIKGLGQALVWGVWFGCAYLALEPWVRRSWPDVLISWARLLTGQWRSPLVGRDILIGAVGGVACVLLAQLVFLVPGWLGFHTVTPLLSRGLEGGRAALSMFFTHWFLGWPLFLLFLLTVLLSVARTHWLSVIGTWCLLMVVFVPNSLITDGVTDINLARTVHLGLYFAVLLFVLIRFGLLATVAVVFFYDRLRWAPLTLDTDAWYASTSLLVLGVLTGLVLYAFRLAATARPVRPDLTLATSTSDL